MASRVARSSPPSPLPSTTVPQLRSSAVWGGGATSPKLGWRGTQTRATPEGAQRPALASRLPPSVCTSRRHTEQWPRSRACAAPPPATPPTPSRPLWPPTTLPPRPRHLQMTKNAPVSRHAAKKHPQCPSVAPGGAPPRTLLVAQRVSGGRGRPCGALATSSPTPSLHYHYHH